MASFHGVIYKGYYTQTQAKREKPELVYFFVCPDAVSTKKYTSSGFGRPKRLLLQQNLSNLRDDLVEIIHRLYEEFHGTESRSFIDVAFLIKV